MDNRDIIKVFVEHLPVITSQPFHCSIVPYTITNTTYSIILWIWFEIVPTICVNLHTQLGEMLIVVDRERLIDSLFSQTQGKSIRVMFLYLGSDINLY